MGTTLGKNTTRRRILPVSLLMASGCFLLPQDDDPAQGDPSMPAAEVQIYHGGERIERGRNYAVVAQQAVIFDGLAPLAVDGDTLTIRALDEALAIRPGQVVVVSHPSVGGIARQVLAATENRDGTVTYATRVAKLTDVFSETQIAVGLVNPNTPGWINLNAEVQHDWNTRLDQRVDLGAGAALDLAVDFRLGTKGAMTVVLGWKDTRLDALALVFDGQVRHSATLDLNVPLASFDPAPFTVELPQVPLGKVPIFPALWISIEIQPIPELRLGLAADLHASTGYEASFEYRGGFAYEAGQGVQRISEFDTSFSLQPPTWSLNGNANARATLWFQVSAQINDLAGPALGLGPFAQVGASIARTPDDNLSCEISAQIGLDARLALDTGALGDWADLGDLEDLEWDILEPDIVRDVYSDPDACDLTVGMGGVRGHVADAVTGRDLAGVQISVRDAAGVVAMATTDGDGDYRITELDPGRHRLVFSQMGYLPVEASVTVEPGADVAVETVLQIDAQYDGAGHVDGTVVDAVTGDALQGVSIAFREGINRRDGGAVATVTTDRSGDYAVDLDAGHYTAALSMSGYIDSVFTLTVLGGRQHTSDLTLSPTLDESSARVVLTWGESPRDLDAHLLKISDGDTQYHLSFANPSEVDANLDRDDTTSFGPETITLDQLDPTARYVFYVHDYSNRSRASATAMADSGAQVVLAIGGVEYRYPVPHMPGTVWKPFEISNGIVLPCRGTCVASDQDAAPNLYGGFDGGEILARFRDLPDK